MNVAEETEDRRVLFFIMPRKRDVDDGELKVRGLEDSFVLCVANDISCAGCNDV